jgi:hypothetical protein
LAQFIIGNHLLIVASLTTNCACSYSSHQQELDMIPLMMQKDFRPKGWLGLILGTRLWYGFWDADEDSDATFGRRLDPVVREVGTTA